jgi:hypothetical protein
LLRLTSELSGTAHTTVKPAAAMRNAAALWKTALQELQQLPTGPQQAGPDEHSAAFPDTLSPLPSVYEFLQSPKANSSIWKQLVNDLQVTHRTLLCRSQCCMLPLSRSRFQVHGYGSPQHTVPTQTEVLPERIGWASC